MTDTTGKLALHVHHSGLPFEILREDIKVRQTFILKNKPKHEIPLRLRLMKVVEEEPPAGMAVTLKALADHNKVCDAALADYNKVCDAALADCNKVRDAALADYNKVRVAALADCNKVCDAHADEIIAFHKKACVPDCPWTWESRTIFPKPQVEA